MSIIGYVRREGDGFAGRLTTLSFDAAVRLVPAARQSAKGPDYRVLAGDHEVGVAWKAADATGALLNIKLDDPAWPEPVNARLMAAEDEPLPVTWIRRSEAPRTAAAPPPDPAP